MGVVLRIRDVVDVGDVGKDGLQIEGGPDHQGAFGVGEAGKGDPDRLAGRALCAVRSDDVAGAQGLCLVLTPDGYLNLVLFLPDVRDFPSEAQVYSRHVREPLVQVPGELVLLALQAVGVPCVVRE